MNHKLIEVKSPKGALLALDQLTDRQFDEEIEKGLADVRAGHTKPASAVFNEIRQNHGL